MPLHPYPVSEECAAGIRTGGVDSDNPDGEAFGSHQRGKSVNESALAYPRRARDPDAIGLPSVRVNLGQDLRGTWVASLKERY